MLLTIVALNSCELCCQILASLNLPDTQRDTDVKCRVDDYTSKKPGELIGNGNSFNNKLTDFQNLFASKRLILSKPGEVSAWRQRQRQDKSLA
jgi:hypothetical protein